MEFTLKNVRIKVSFLFFLMLTMSFAADKYGIAYIAAVSVTFHELAHIAVMTASLTPPQRITLGLFGIRISKSCMTYGQEIFTALAGPLANIALSLISFLFSLSGFAQFWRLCAAVNLAIALFNLLPASYLDGAVALCAYLSLRHSPYTAIRITNAVGTVTVFILLISGAVLAALTKGNFSLLFTGAYLALLLIKGIKK